MVSARGVDILRVHILTVDILRVDILRVDILRVDDLGGTHSLTWLNVGRGHRPCNYYKLMILVVLVRVKIVYCEHMFKRNSNLLCHNCPTHLSRKCPTHLSYECSTHQAIIVHFHIPIFTLLVHAKFKFSYMVNIAGVCAPPVNKQLHAHLRNLNMAEYM